MFFYEKLAIIMRMLKRERKKKRKTKELESAAGTRSSWSERRWMTKHAVPNVVAFGLEFKPTSNFASNHHLLAFPALHIAITMVRTCSDTNCMFGENLTQCYDSQFAPL